MFCKKLFSLTTKKFFELKLLFCKNCLFSSIGYYEQNEVNFQTLFLSKINYEIKGILKKFYKQWLT